MTKRFSIRAVLGCALMAALCFAPNALRAQETAQPAQQSGETLLGHAALGEAALGQAARQYETVYFARLANGFSIRHLRHEEIGGVTRLYLGRSAEAGYADVPTAQIAQMESEQVPLPVNAAPVATAVAAPRERPVAELIHDAAGQSQIDEDFLASVVRAESGFNPKAVSPKGAQGLMQLMPGTAAKLGVHNAFSPAENVKGGTEYLRQLLEQYHGDAQKALAAYNAGPQRVAQYKGVPPYHETRAYVARIINDYNRKKMASRTALNPKASTIALSRKASTTAAHSSVAKVSAASSRLGEGRGGAATAPTGGTE